MAKRIFLCAGHSKVSPGYVTREFREFDLNYEALKIISKRLQKMGFEVIELDETVYDLPYPQYLTRRIEIINDMHASRRIDLAIDLHHNSSSSVRVNGAWFIYGSEAGGNLSRIMAATMQSIGHRARDMSLEELGRRLGFIKKTHPVAVIVENAFMSGAVDKLILRFARGLLYNAVADAIADSLNS